MNTSTRVILPTTVVDGLFDANNPSSGNPFATINDITPVSTDVTTLKNNEYKITYYSIVAGTSGTITPPTNSTFNADEFGTSGNCILSKVDGNNKPTYQTPTTTSGVVVTASLNTTTGAWVTSGVYTDLAVALIYSLEVKAIDYNNLVYSNIIESVVLNGVMVSGGYGVTFNVTGTTNLILPTSGTVLTTATGLSNTLSSGNIFVGNSSNIAAGAVMSGGATINNLGVVSLNNASVIGQLLTGYTSGAGTITASDSILSAIEKLNGNLVGGYLPINNPNYTGTLTSGTLTYTDTNILGALQSSVNSYNQFVLQNSNSGATASSDFVVNNNNSTATTYYGDFGMNSSGFSGSGSFNLPNAVYLSSTSGDLVLGTTTSNLIRFVTNNGSTDAMSISASGLLTANLAAMTMSLGSDATGDIYYRASTGLLTKLAIPTANKFLWSSGTIPNWSGYSMPATIAAANCIPFASSTTAITTSTAFKFSSVSPTLTLTGTTPGLALIAGSNTGGITNTSSTNTLAIFSGSGVGSITLGNGSGIVDLTITDTSSTFTTSVTASSFIKSGGTSTQVLMADGSVSTSFLTGTGTSNYIPRYNGSNSFTNDATFQYNGTYQTINTSGSSFIITPQALAIKTINNTSQEQIVIEDAGTTAGTGIIFNEDGSSKYSGIFRYNSAYGGSFGGTSISHNGVLQIQSGGGNSYPLFLSASRTYNTSGFTSTNMASVQDAIGFRVDQLQNIQTTNLNAFTVNGNTYLGGNITATAKLHLVAGTATANSSPLKFTSGIPLTTPENGAFETDSNNNLWYTNTTNARGKVDVINTSVSSAATLNITVTYSYYIFSGTTATWTLPVVTGNTNVNFYVKNRGSGILTINSNAGGNDIYSTSAVSTFSVNPGQAYLIVNDGTYYNIQ